ncbi:MAG: hypothetical protein GY853_10695 [PVC group bacterium]|nr:hypothetical protein [PVC group bacterium]
MKILKAFIISVTFLAGFSLLYFGVVKKIRNKKIFSVFLEVFYFLCFWTYIYIYHI